MEHLYASVVRVERPGVVEDAEGYVEQGWTVAPEEGMDYVRCRLDLNFLRPGKDIAPAPVAGRAPDRIGLMFCGPYVPIRAGDRIVAIPNDMGEIVIPGTFEIRVVPDKVVGFSSIHHQEIQILETTQDIHGSWKGPEDGDNPV
jgi:hypothetical protein